MAIPYPGRLWRVEDGTITYFNSLPQHRLAPPVEDIPARLELIPNGFVSKREIIGIGRQATVEDPQITRGAVYDTNGRILDEFLDRAAWSDDKLSRPDDPPEIEYARTAAARVVEGPCVYLGELKLHFGHFLLESLGRAWPLGILSEDVKVIYHPPASRVSFNNFAGMILEFLGVKKDNIVIASEDLLVKELLVPTCQYWISQKAGPSMCVTFDHLRERLLEKTTPGKTFGNRIYLSRQKLGEQPPAVAARRAAAAASQPEMTQRLADRLARKKVVNEDEVEAVFVKHGFQVLFPETLSFPDQVRAISGADVVAGVTGSALHLALVNGKPTTKIVSVATRFSINQILIEKIRGLQGIHILCGMRASPQDARTKVDLDVLERALSELAL